MRTREKISFIGKIVKAVIAGGEVKIRGSHKDAIFYERKDYFIEMDIVNKDKSWNNSVTLCDKDSYIKAFNLINFLVMDIEDELKNNREVFKSLH